MHRNNSSIAMHRDRIASWHVNRDTNRIVTSLAIPTPSKEMAFLKSTYDSSLIYRFLTVFDFVCMSGIKYILKKTLKWSDKEGSVTERSETL